MAGQETYLLTNEHVAVWPEVTDSRHQVPGVSEGCKRVEAKLRIVQDEQSEEEANQIPLKLVASDPRLDAAILKAPQPLTVLPHRIGKSAALRQGNAVEVRGFPLGLLHAVNTGKVVNPYDVDLEQGWDHVDFVIDALLSEGNSGSPVLALSCRTGRLELVGMYHAGYKEASALNVVVGIDQLRDFMTRKRRIPRASSDGPVLSAAERRRLEERLASGGLPLFQFGGPDGGGRTDRRTACATTCTGGSSPSTSGGWPSSRTAPRPSSFGELGRLLVRGEGGWREAGQGELGEDDRDLLARVADALRLHMLRVLEYRRLLDGARQRRRTPARPGDPQGPGAPGPARTRAGPEPDRPDRTPGPQPRVHRSPAPRASTPASPAPPTIVRRARGRASSLAQSLDSQPALGPVSGSAPAGG